MLSKKCLCGILGASLIAVAAAAAPAWGTSITASTIDYGPLGPLTKDAVYQYRDLDPKIDTRSPSATIAMFRANETHPPRGTEDHPISWDAIDEHEDYQRTLFYLVARRAPKSITPNDWKMVRAEEKELIRSSCANAGASGVRYELSRAQCKKAGAEYQ